VKATGGGNEGREDGGEQAAGGFSFLLQRAFCACLFTSTIAAGVPQLPAVERGRTGRAARRQTRQATLARRRAPGGRRAACLAATPPPLPPPALATPSWRHAAIRAILSSVDCYCRHCLANCNAALRRLYHTAHLRYLLRFSRGCFRGLARCRIPVDRMAKDALCRALHCLLLPLTRAARASSASVTRGLLFCDGGDDAGIAAGLDARSDSALQQRAAGWCWRMVPPRRCLLCCGRLPALPLARLPAPWTLSFLVA